MKRLLPALALLLLTGCSYLGLTSKEPAPAPAAEQTAAVAPQPAPAPQPTLAVADGWAMPTPKSAKTAAGFFTVANTGGADDRLLSVTSPRAKSVEIQEMAVDGTKTKLRPTDGVAVPAGAAVTLNDKGTRLVFNGINAPFKDGETVPVKLTFEKSGTVDATLTVKKPAK